MALQGITRQNITDITYGQFMNSIVSGEWKQGEKIPSESDLAASLGISRITVRSALQKLASYGLIESRQGEGTFVRSFSGAQYLNNLIPILVLGRPALKNLLEFRMIFDSEMASLAATRASEEQIIRLEENLSRHKLYKDNPQKAAECDMEFHYLIAEATGNDFLAQIYTVLKEILQYALYDIVKVMGTKNAYIYHSNIIQAIRNKDVWGARECMRAHILDTIAASEGSENKAEEAQGKPAL